MSDENVDFNEIDQAEPQILIYGELDGIVTDTNAIAIAGSIANQDTLYINGEEIEVHDDGGFSQYYELQYGENKFTITAIGKNGSSVEYTSIVTREKTIQKNAKSVFVIMIGIILLGVAIALAIMSIKKRHGESGDIGTNIDGGGNGTEVKQNKTFRLTHENMFHIFLLILPFIIIYISSNYILHFATVVSGSMSPTVRTGDYVIINRLAYAVNEPERGDIVSFDNKEINMNMIKRIIGLPGETIEIKNGNVYINGEILEEDYLRYGTVTAPLLTNSIFHVPDNCYFMLGDNREHSTDSRFWQNPYIPLDDFVGELLVAW